MSLRGAQRRGNPHPQNHACCRKYTKRRTDCQKVNCPKGKRCHPGVRQREHWRAMTWFSLPDTLIVTVPKSLPIGGGMPPPYSSFVTARVSILPGGNIFPPYRAYSSNRRKRSEGVDAFSRGLKNSPPCPPLRPLGGMRNEECGDRPPGRSADFRYPPGFDQHTVVHPYGTGMLPRYHRYPSAGS